MRYCSLQELFTLHHRKLCRLRRLPDKLLQEVPSELPWTGLLRASTLKNLSLLDSKPRAQDLASDSESAFTVGRGLAAKKCRLGRAVKMGIADS